MKVNRRFRKKMKRFFKPYYLLLFIVIVASIVLSIIFLPQLIGGTKYAEVETDSGEKVKIVIPDVKQGEEISEASAKKTAVKQFEQLGEKTSEGNINCEKIQRKGELYYYLTSANNSMEIQIKNGKVTRINSIPVEYQ